MGPDMAVDRKPDFFEDLFLNRAGGGGKDYMMPMEASERKDLNEFFILGGDDMKKAKEIEAERIFPILQDKTMQIIDVVLDMPESEEREKILYDINHGHLDNAEGTGMTKVANARYETIQKYGYLLDKPGAGGLGSMMPRKAEKADGGLMRTNFAMGSDDDPKPLPEDPTKPVNPFAPKPIKPLGDMRMADVSYSRKERAQMLADELAEEEFGMDFYDLDIRTQMKIYQIALDMIDEGGGNAMGGLPNDRTQTSWFIKKVSVFLDSFISCVCNFCHSCAFCVI